MPCDILIRATDGSNLYEKGYVVTVKDTPCIWGSKEYLPDFIHLIVPDATAAQVENYLENWPIKFSHTLLNENELGYRILIEVDPVYISASGIGAQQIKTLMQEWAEDLMGFTVVNFTSSSMTVDIPKPADLVSIKGQFADTFDDVLSIRRYYFAASDVDAVVSAGGEVTRTRQQVLGLIIDKLSE